jgi:hypothetical protein
MGGDDIAAARERELDSLKSGAEAPRRRICDRIAA